MLADGITAQCVAIQDEYVFKCPFSLLIHVQTMRKNNEELHKRTSRRCGCGVNVCDARSLIVVDSLIKWELRHRNIKELKTQPL